MTLQLSERQAKTVGAAITTVSAVVILLAVVLLGWLIAAFVRYFSGVFLPLAVGAIAALVCRPYYDWLRERLRLPSAIAVVVVFLSVMVPLGGFGWFFGQMLVTQLGELAANLPQWVETLRAWIEERVPRLAETMRASGLDERLRQAAENQQAAIVEGLQQVGAQAFSAGVGIARAFSALFGWAILPVYFAYFLTAKGLRLDTAQLLPFLKSDTRDDVEYLVRGFVDMIVAFFRGQLVIAFLQGVLYAGGFTVIGLRYGFAIGLLLGMLNVIPYLGAIVGLGIAVPLAMLQPDGGPPLTIAALVVIAVVQQIESWFLTPKIMGDRTGLHFMAIIVAIFFWGTALGGILGMIMAIPLTAFFASLWRLAREKYIPEII